MKIKEWVDKEDPGSIMIPFSGVFEQELSLVPEDEKEAFIKETGVGRFLLPVITKFHCLM